MNHALLALLAASAATPGTAQLPRGARRNLTPRRRYTRLPGPEDVPCPRCGAEAGQPCDHRTLGSHPYHRARVEAFRAMKEDR